MQPSGAVVLVVLVDRVGELQRDRDRHIDAPLSAGIVAPRAVGEHSLEVGLLGERPDARRLQTPP